MAGRDVLEVLDGGLLTTVQDDGRPGFGHLGVPIGGACDPLGLAVANVVVGNEPGAAALEATLLGPRLRVLAPTLVGIGGADLGGVDRSTGRRLEPGGAYAVRSGAEIEFPGPPPGVPGVRTYLAVPGGIDVPAVLGSASTCLVGGFGGLDGRPVRAGDRLAAADGADGGPARRTAATAAAARRWPGSADHWGEPTRVRVIATAAGPGLDEAESRHAFAGLVATRWTVSSASDRVGIRLDGRPLGAARATELASHGVVWGAVQLPPDGQPIVLLADHQSTGGYPVVAVAIVADRPALGQLRPGDAVRFAEATVDEARWALREHVEAFGRAAASLAEGVRWDALWHEAGG